MLQTTALCSCVGRPKPREDQEEDSDFLDLHDAEQEEERMQEEWQWLSIRCERRLNEQLRCYQQELAKRCDAVQSKEAIPAPPTEFTSYVPKLLRRFIHGRLGVSEPEPRDIADSYAVTVFCDVSGFTALAEAIERSGDPQAAATLGRSLNSFYDPLICIINRWGGDIMKFSGDAVLVAWFINDRKDTTESAIVEDDHTAASNSTTEARLDDVWKQCALALKCCDELHKTLHEFPTGIDNKTLTMHIGIGLGNVAIVHVGGMMERWEFVLAGKPLEEIAVAEPLASKGQTVMSRSVYEIMKSHISASEVEGNCEYFLFRGFTEQVNVEPDDEVHQTFEFPQESVTAFRPYMPSYIFFRLMSGYSVFNNEMRRLSTIFVSVPGLDVASPLGRETAQQLMNICQRATYALEGSLNKFLVDDKGVVLLIFIGFPPVYHTDDPVRSVFVGLKIVNDCAKLGVSPGVGITTGPVWCGTLGNYIRREYTCLGDYVNLAARLMAKAAASKEHHIIVDETTAREAGHFLEFKELEEVRLKGKEESTKIFTPTGKVHKLDSHALEYRTPLETWRRWDAYKAVKSRLTDSSLLDHGGLMLIEGHRGCGTQDLQAAITRFIKKQGYTNCFSLSTMKEKSLAISITADANCAWRDLCNGLVSAWASSSSRRAMVSSCHSKHLYVQSDHCVSKKVVCDVVKELLDPIYHWRMGALKPLIMGLEVEPLRNVFNHRLNPSSHHQHGISGVIKRWVGRSSCEESDSEVEAEKSESTDHTVCDTTLLEQRIMQEPIAPFVTSMVEGFSMNEPICIVLNILRGSSVNATMDDSAWSTISELSKLAMSRRHDLMAGTSGGKPILFIVVSSPQYVFVNWHEDLVKLATECNACIQLSRLNNIQLVDFVAHSLNLESSANVPQELLDHIYKNTSGMAQFVYKTLDKLVDSGALTLEDVSEDSSSDVEDSNLPPGARLMRRSDIIDLFNIPRMRNHKAMGVHQMQDFGISLEHPLRQKKRLVQVNLEGVGSIDEILAFAMSVVDRLKPYELFVAKVACLLQEPFTRKDLLGSNPHGLGIDQFDAILRSLIANEVLETISTDPLSDSIGPNVELRLCSNAMISVLQQRVLEEELEWFASHFAVK